MPEASIASAAVGPCPGRALMLSMHLSSAGVGAGRVSLSRASSAPSRRHRSAHPRPARLPMRPGQGSPCDGPCLDPDGRRSTELRRDGSWRSASTRLGSYCRGRRSGDELLRSQDAAPGVLPEPSANVRRTARIDDFGDLRSDLVGRQHGRLERHAINQRRTTSEQFVLRYVVPDR
jgi:hypothetical protein